MMWSIIIEDVGILSALTNYARKGRGVAVEEVLLDR